MSAWLPLSLLSPVLWAPLVLAPGADREDPPPLHDAVRARLEDLSRLESREAVDALHDLCLSRHGELTPLLAALDEAAEGEDVARAVAAKRLASRLLWRQGDLRTAAKLLDEVVEAAPTIEDRLARAALLDAAGRTSDAFAAYESLAGEVEDPSAKDRLLVRLALMELDRDGEAASRLEALARAEGRSPDERRRAAIVLALCGRPGDALALHPVEGEGSERFRAELRSAEWALRAEDPESAREAAWRAVSAATLERDRRYALAILVEAYREDDALPALVDRLAAEEGGSAEARRVWIDLLRETGRVDEALEILRAERVGDAFTPEMRRELLEMCRDAGREEELVAEYERLIEAEPRSLQWREGLARHRVERGDAEAARELFRPLAEDMSFATQWLECAERTRSLGLDELASRFAEQVVERGLEDVAAAYLFRFDLERSRGRLAEAEAILARFDAGVPAAAPSRGALAEAYEQLGRPDRAVAVLEALRTARGEQEFGEDLEMRLAWLHSEVGNEETALERWQQLWRRVDSVARRRYVEDRLMNVAARLGRLADVAIDLERRLAAGGATDRDAGLLVRLYTKANDPVSASEVLEEFMKGKGSSDVAILTEKSRVHLACADYFGFEEALRELIEVDEENRVEHLRQLAMSQLERGKPDEAKETLVRLNDLEGGVEGAEFEAGVLALAGLRDEAARAYRRGLAAHPDRIEAYLLLADVLEEQGDAKTAIGMFQYLAEHAEKDDLFTIAIDGLLNLEAPPPVLKWARRVTLERIAGRHEEMYLYQLLADLSQELGRPQDVLETLESALPIAGERRSSLLRELMELASTGPRRSGGDRERQLRYGRRLVALAELVPPEVHLELGRAFLENDEPIQASKTFALAQDVPDLERFQAEVARAFEAAGYVQDALRVVERSLVARPNDVELVVKVAELHERLGREDVAQPMFSRALDLLLKRRPRADAKAEKEGAEANRGYARNVDDWESHSARALTGILATTDPGDEVDRLLAREEERVAEELAARDEEPRGEDDDEAAEEEEEEEEEDRRLRLESLPRLAQSSAVHRRFAFAFGRVGDADRLDRRLLQAFPKDDALLERLVRERMAWGLVRSARALVEASGRPAEERRRVLVLTGAGGVDEASGTLPLREVEGLVMPALVEGRREDARSLLRRTDFSSVDEESLGALETLFGAAAVLNDPDLMLLFGRQWIHAVVHHAPGGGSSWVVEGVLARCGRVLDDELEWTLAQSVVSLLLDERLKDRAKGLVQLLPSLQKRFARPLLEPDAVTNLLVERFSGSPWGAGAMFELIPAADRPRIFRTVWPKVAKTQRANFVLNLVSELTEGVSPSFADLLVESFGGALADTEQKEFLRYSIRGVVDDGRHPTLALRLLERAREGGVKHVSLELTRAALLARIEGPEAALPAALAVLRDALPKAGADEWDDWDTRQALARVHARFLPEHADAVLAVIAEVEAQTGASPELAQIRLDVLGTRDDPDAEIAALETELQRHEGDETLLRRLEATLSRAGRRREALEVAERILAAEDDERQRERERGRLVRGWLTLRHPERALAVMEEAEESAPRRDEVEAAAARSRKLPPATLDALKEAVDGGDLALARSLYHRLWRGDGGGGPVVRYVVVHGVVQALGGGYVPPYWPEEEDATSTPKERERDRGGLPEWVTRPSDADEEEDDDEERTRTLDVLLRHDFGHQETWRRLRTQVGTQLAQETDTFDALAERFSEREGRAEASRRLQERLRAGTGGVAESAMVLALVAQDPAAVAEEERAMLADVLHTVRPDDVDALRRLARVFARTGDSEASARLFRWCATRTDDDGFGGGERIDPHELIDDVRECLDGAARVAVIDDVLAWAEPGEVAWRRENYEELALSTWEELLGPAAALERGRAICEGVLVPPSEPYQGFRRGTARRAARLFALAGELDLAVRALEVAVARMETPSEEQDVSFSFLAGGGIVLDTDRGTGHLGEDDLHVLFPASAEGFPGEEERRAWLARAGAAVAEWTRAGRMSRPTAVQALVVAAVRLDVPERTADLLDAARAAAGDSPDALLWVADAQRWRGRPDLADAIERELFERGALNPERVPDVVARVAAAEGPEKATAIAERALELGRHPRLLEELATAALRAGDVARHARIVELERARDDAEREVEARLEAKRKESR